MTGEAAEAKAEIVIVRRRGGEEVAAHKGGAWKIAYADFVTAMMAFFLVMWLINASNESTRSQVASYFNPIKLTDNATGGRGLNDMKDAKATDKSHGNPQDRKASAAEKTQELQVLADPKKTLDKVAGDVQQTTTADAVKTVAGAPAVPTDPFDPLAWQTSSNAPEAPKTPDAARPDKKPAETAASGAAQHAEGQAASAKAGSGPEKAEGQTGKPAAATDAKDTGATKSVAIPPEKAIAPQPASKAEAPPKAEPPPAAPPAAAAGTVGQDAVSAEIRREILKRLNIDSSQLPADITVKATAEGQLISLTDRSAYGMFKLGSAEPNPKMVALVETIAAVLKDRPGYIVVRGHTDSLPYRNRTYDNWQLSTARAQMAYYMLLRGGLDEQRVRRIEGYADRQPIFPEHPDAPENRRIDILLGQDT